MLEDVEGAAWGQRGDGVKGRDVLFASNRCSGPGVQAGVELAQPFSKNNKLEKEKLRENGRTSGDSSCRPRVVSVKLASASRTV